LIAYIFNPVEFRGNYSATHYEVGTLAVDEWAVTFGTARRGLGGAAARPGPSSGPPCTKFTDTVIYRL